jgi:hypothetical protein
MRARVIRWATDVDSSVNKPLVCAPAILDIISQPTKVLIHRISFIPTVVLLQSGAHIEEICIGRDTTQPHQACEANPC